MFLRWGGALTGLLTAAFILARCNESPNYQELRTVDSSLSDEFLFSQPKIFSGQGRFTCEFRLSGFRGYLEGRFGHEDNKLLQGRPVEVSFTIPGRSSAGKSINLTPPQSITDDNKWQNREYIVFADFSITSDGTHAKVSIPEELVESDASDEIIDLYSEPCVLDDQDIPLARTEDISRYKLHRFERHLRCSGGKNGEYYQVDFITTLFNRVKSSPAPMLAFDSLYEYQSVPKGPYAIEWTLARGWEIKGFFPTVVFNLYERNNSVGQATLSRQEGQETNEITLDCYKIRELDKQGGEAYSSRPFEHKDLFEILHYYGK